MLRRLENCLMRRQRRRDRDRADGPRRLQHRDQGVTGESIIRSGIDPGRRRRSPPAGSAGRQGERRRRASYGAAVRHPVTTSTCSMSERYASHRRRHRPSRCSVRSRCERPTSPEAGAACAAHQAEVRHLPPHVAAERQAPRARLLPWKATTGRRRRGHPTPRSRSPDRRARRTVPRGGWRGARPCSRTRSPPARPRRFRPGLVSTNPGSRPRPGRRRVSARSDR